VFFTDKRKIPVLRMGLENKGWLTARCHKEQPAITLPDHGNPGLKKREPAAANFFPERL
jgi:hypothetical protein